MSKKTADLTRLSSQISKLANRAATIGERNVAIELLRVAELVSKKRDGHRANAKKRK